MNQLLAAPRGVPRPVPYRGGAVGLSGTRGGARFRADGLAAPNELTVALCEARLHEERAWKLMSLAHRLLFATSPRGGKGNKSFSEVLRCRVRWLEEGNWPFLYKDVERCRRAGRPRGSRQPGQAAGQPTRRRARRVAALFKEGEVGKATAAVMAKARKGVLVVDEGERLCLKEIIRYSNIPCYQHRASCNLRGDSVLRGGLQPVKPLSLLEALRFLQQRKHSSRPYPLYVCFGVVPPCVHVKL